MEETIQYLTELRRRLLRCVIVFASIFILLAMYSNTVYRLFAHPLLMRLGGHGLIATSVISPFLVPYKASFALSLYISVPYFLYECWMFILPALYFRERRWLWFLFLSSLLLFYVGTLFAYFIVLPWMFQFFIHAAPIGVEVKPDVSNYLNFVLQIIFAFGLAFELPVVMILLVRTGLVSREQLKSKRPYVIVGAFVVGMLLTPPDVVSQTMLAIPLCLLYELGLLMIRFR